MNTSAELFRNEKVIKILLKLAPPVMLAQLIQALYNLVDSFFVGKYSGEGLTALSIIYPIQLLMIAFAVGTGVGINTIMAARFGVGDSRKADEFAGVGTPLAGALWLIFAAVCWLILPGYARMSTGSAEVIAEVVAYGRIVCLFSFGLFFESVWTKILQAGGDMKTPMLAQICGAVTNIALDPILIFGWLGLPELGIRGAAIATVVGQAVAALVVFKKAYRPIPSPKIWLSCTGKIFHTGIPNILMQSAYTFYILGLNLILAGFSDQAVTALGLYYKWQTFFFIPLGAMQTCIVPVISFNFATRDIAIGAYGFRLIGSSFIPMVTSLIFPVFFQAVGYSLKSSLLTVIRTVLLFVPLGYLFSLWGLHTFWLTFPITEVLTSTVGLLFYRQFLKRYDRQPDAAARALKS